jgi:hypothetical protein
MVGGQVNRRPRWQLVCTEVLGDHQPAADACLYGAGAGAGAGGRGRVRQVGCQSSVTT